MQTIADELVELWNDGNRSFVVDEIIFWRPAQIALLTGLMVVQMSTEDRTVFFRMLREKI